MEIDKKLELYMSNKEKTIRAQQGIITSLIGLIQCHVQQLSEAEIKLVQDLKHENTSLQIEARAMETDFKKQNNGR